MDLNDPNFDLEAYLSQRIKEEVASAGVATPPTGTPPPAPAPLAVKIGGTEYKFNSQDELSAALETTFSRFQQELAAAQAPKTPPIPDPKDAPLTGKEKPDWSMDTYISMMAKDPREAADYLDDHRDSVKTVRAAVQDTEQIRKMIAIEQFRLKHPEFPLNNDAAAHLVNQTREQLNLPYTADGLEAAYLMSLNKNEQFRNFVAQNTPQPTQDHRAGPQNPYAAPQAPPQGPPLPWAQPGNNPYLAPPPQVSRTQPFQNVSENQLRDFENLTAEQQESVLRGMKVS